MTINERTAALYDHLRTFSGGAPLDLLAILATIREAVAEEREGCAMLAEELAEENHAERGTLFAVADEIRARANHPEPPPAANPPPQPPRHGGQG